MAQRNPTCSKLSQPSISKCITQNARLKRTRRFNSTQPINCGHQIITSAGGFVLRSELLRILFRVTTIATEQSIRGTVLIVLVSLILFRLIKLVESLASIRKTVPRVLCGQMRELWRVDVELGVGVTIRRHVVRDDVHRSHFVLLFPLHASVLEPKRIIDYIDCGGATRPVTHQILICRSVKHNAWAISIRRLRVKYRLKWNSFSSSSVW